MHPDHFRADIVRPTLTYLGMWSDAAENLIVGTALAESNLSFLHQFNDGPALGVMQIEPATHDDVWNNFLAFRPPLSGKMNRLLAAEPERRRQLQTNLAYAVAMARLVYYRHPDPLPEAHDLQGLALTWKTVYNTPLGAGRPEEFIRRYEAAHPLNGL